MDYLFSLESIWCLTLILAYIIFFHNLKDIIYLKKENFKSKWDIKNLNIIIEEQKKEINFLFNKINKK